MNAGLAELFARRLLLITGKGGTGKTTVAAALARLAADSGVRTVLVELGGEALAPPLLGAPPYAEGRGLREPEPIDENLFALRLDPEDALAEYLELQVRIRALVRAVLGNAAFHRFLDAAPGWRELITLGKLWHLSSREEHGRPRWPLLIVDAPATGHGLSLLSVPGVVLEGVRLGPLRRNTDAVQALLTDPARTWVVPVSLAEELPTSETLELLAKLEALGVARGPVVMNGIEPPLALPDPKRALAALSKLDGAAAPTPLVEPHALAAAVEHHWARAQLQRGFVSRFATATGAAPLELPWLESGADRPEGVRALAAQLRTALEARAT